MPRPCKRRRICAEPSCRLFGPKGTGGRELPAVTMTLDEYESIRLIDLEGMTQEQCAAQMGVARTTAQSIYGSARAKLAECLVNEKDLVIAGGDYEICEHGKERVQWGRGCGMGCRYRCHQGARGTCSDTGQGQERQRCPKLEPGRDAAEKK